MKQLMGKRGAFAARPLAFEISRMFGTPSVGFALLAAMAVPAAYADPQGGSVVAGQASIAKSGATTTITQATQRAAIDWRSFNVGATETVKFEQPNASSSTLNRVVGNDASAIFGRITANGTVLLINPNGILFGRTAQVDVGGLVASTANITNADFMAGKMAFTQPGNPGATVENQGSITIGQGGFAALVGRGVSNSGVINARLGKVSLAAGDAFVLDLYGDKLVNLIVDPAAMTTLTDASGLPLAARVDHSGNIVAEGGIVQLTTGVVKQLVDNIINVSGTIRATSFDTAPGLISLRGDAQTQLAISGTLDASGNRGGRIEATARDVVLSSSALVDASGSHSGGIVAIGGDWQGKGNLTNAQTVTVARGARIDVSATEDGAGGTASVWADGDTRFEGLVMARGGRTAGDGGNVEVSGRKTLTFDGDVNASAHTGTSGKLLLDPTNLIVADIGNSNFPTATDLGDYSVSSNAIRRVISQGTSLTLQASKDIDVNSAIDGRVQSGGVSGGALTLTAGRNITIGKSILLDDAKLEVKADGTFTQAPEALLSTGTGALDIRAIGNISAQQLLSNGAVTLKSSQGIVSVSRPVIGANDISGGSTSTQSLTVDGYGGVSLNGARVAGAVTLTSAFGPVSFTDVLEATGVTTVRAVGEVAFDSANLAGLSVRDAAGIGGVAKFTASGALVSTSDLDVLSEGNIVLGVGAQTRGSSSLKLVSHKAIQFGSETIIKSANDLTLNSTSDMVVNGQLAAQGSIYLAADGIVTMKKLVDAGGNLDVSASGAVTLSDVNVGGLSIHGYTDKTSATGGKVTFSGNVDADNDASAHPGKTLGSGLIDVHASGDLETKTNVTLSAAQVNLTSDRGAITLGGADGAVPSKAGIKAVRSGNVTIAAAGNVVAFGSLRTTGGAISVISESNDLGISLGSVQTNDSSGAGLSGSLTARAPRGSVVLRESLGGQGTGYQDFASGYMGRLLISRPDVGQIDVSASNAIETNGLNLDGTSYVGAVGGSPGLALSVSGTGARIIINRQVAVNKGDIRITAPLGQVLVGASIYSRGHDLADHSKTSYSISISGLSIGIWDNDSQFALLASGRSFPISYQKSSELPCSATGSEICTYYDSDGSYTFLKNIVAKITIANNSANYVDKETALVDAQNSAQTEIKVAGEILSTIEAGGLPAGQNDIRANQAVTFTGDLAKGRNYVEGRNIVGRSTVYTNSSPKKAVSDFCILADCTEKAGDGLSLKIVTFTGADIATSFATTTVPEVAGTATLVSTPNSFPVSTFSAGPVSFLRNRYIEVEATGDQRGTRLLLYPGIIATNYSSAIIDSRTARETEYPTAPSNSSSSTSFASIGDLSFSINSRPCRIQLIAGSDHEGRLGDGRRFGVRADFLGLVRCGMACSSQARHAITAEKA